MPPTTKEPSFEEGTAVESTLWTCKECYVYQIPPLKNESGHRANDWDVNKWLWSGKLVVVALGETVQVRLVDSDAGSLFAVCPMDSPTSKAIDPVVDSSRYFVLRVDDGKGRHAFLGLGFRDRSDSYDFNATLQDHWKGVQRQKEADELRKEMEARHASEPARDLSLKDGEKINIKVNVPQKGERAPRPRPAGGSSEGLKLAPPPSGGLLAPPPPAKPVLISPPATATPPAEDADFGDFDDFKTADSAVDGADFGEFTAG